MSDLPDKPKYQFNTCKSLRLDLEAARMGKTWLLLPEGFRHQQAGNEYPLPTSREELMRIYMLPLPPGRKNDSGCLYIKRCLKKLKVLNKNAQTGALRTYHTEEKVINAHREFGRTLRGLRDQAREATERVKKEAEEAIAGLNDLWALGRKGIEGQMRAHLDGNQWHGEEIDAKAFRDCFKMVSQAVKGLGLPTKERENAAEVVLEEAARAMRSTQEALAMAPSADDEKPVN